MKNDRLIVVSNRLPFVLSRDENNGWKLKPGSGGLVTALVPVLSNRGGIWIGWPGTTEEVPELEKIMDESTKNSGYDLKPVKLTPEEEQNFYYGFANEVIWPLFHDLQSYCNFEPDYWKAYLSVNQKFTDVIAKNVKEGDFIWIHDYHLMNVAKKLRLQGIKNKIGFFLHIPFPPLDIFLKLPWRFEILSALLKYDLLGFQTLRDRRNFIDCVKAIFKDVAVNGKGQIVSAWFEGHEVRIGAFPIGIDAKVFSENASSKEIIRKTKEFQEKFPGRQIILGLDRLDYTKGIPFRIKAFGNALERYPELREKITFIQVVVPSRETIPKYNKLKTDIERLVSEINGKYTRDGWVPIHYIFRSLTQEELYIKYRACEIALVTPLKDGMNLVCKEYASCSRNDSVLILSEFAGAAVQMHRSALLVNPYHIENVADNIYKAYMMQKGERKPRMKRMKKIVTETDIFWWVDSFLRAVIAKDLRDFPLLEDFIPSITSSKLELEYDYA